MSLSKSDEWETPRSMYEWLCHKYSFYPELDVCADYENKKCVEYFGKDHINSQHRDGLDYEWGEKNWMNCPHSDTENWVKKACKEFLEKSHETMGIIPANSMCTSYAEACIEPHAEYHPIFERPRFKNRGVEKDNARNSYFVVLWRQRIG